MKFSQLSDNTRGIIFIIGAMLCFSIEDSFMKFLGANWSPMQILMAIGGLGGTVFALICLKRGLNIFDKALLAPASLLRLTGEVVGTLGYASSVILGSISLSSAIIQTMPLVITMGAAIFLKEHVGWRRWLAVIIGLIGVILIIEPWHERFSIYSLFAIVGVIGLSLRDVSTRAIGRSIPSLVIAVWGFYILVPGALLLLLFGQEFSPVTADAFPPLLAALLLGLLGYYFLILSTNNGELSVIAPFRYSRLIFGLFFGVWFFGESFSIWAGIGATIVIASGVYIRLRERQLQAQD